MAEKKEIVKKWDGWTKAVNMKTNGGTLIIEYPSRHVDGKPTTEAEQKSKLRAKFFPGNTRFPIQGRPCDLLALIEAGMDSEPLTDTLTKYATLQGTATPDAADESESLPTWAQ